MNIGIRALVVLILTACTLVACGGPEGALRTKAAHEFNCTEPQVQIERIPGGILEYHAAGCGKQRNYICPSNEGCEARGPVNPS